MLSNHRADNFDGGRAASEPEQAGSVSELGWLVSPHANADDDDVRALALAIVALTVNASDH
jgi:hypothetical protein